MTRPIYDNEEVEATEPEINDMGRGVVFLILVGACCLLAFVLWVASIIESENREPTPRALGGGHGSRTMDRDCGFPPPFVPVHQNQPEHERAHHA